MARIRRENRQANATNTINWVLIPIFNLLMALKPFVCTGLERGSDWHGTGARRDARPVYWSVAQEY